MEKLPCITFEEFNNFELSLVTEKYMFYINQMEDDENASIKMFDRKMNLLSDNYFAYGAYMEELGNIYRNQVLVLYMSMETLCGYLELTKAGKFEE